MPLNQIGPGTYLLNQTMLCNMPCSPFAIDGSMLRRLAEVDEQTETEKWSRVAAVLIEISQNHGEWCGMDWNHLFAVIRCRMNNESSAFPNPPYDSDGAWIDITVKDMLRCGMLTIPDTKRGLWGILTNWLLLEILCPTPRLIRWVLWYRHPASVLQPAYKKG
jgi:hypothetical protein